MNRIIQYSVSFCLLLVAISVASPRADGDKKKSPQPDRVVVFDGSNLSRKNKDGKELDVTDEGWERARYYFEKEKAPYSGDVILPSFQSTNDVAEAIFTLKNGRQEGEAILLYPGGKPKSEGVFKDGAIELAKGWHENGKKKFEAKIEKGKLVSLQLWTEAGEKKGQSRLPKRIPSYIRGLIAGPALAKAGLSRSALPPPDLGGLTLDYWLKLKANIDQRARYQFVFGNVKDLYVKQKRYNQKQATLAAYNLIRSPQYAYQYLVFIFYGKAALDSLTQGGTFAKQTPENKEPEERVYTGSGFFISRDGYFITNYHVIEDTKKVSVRRGQTTYRAKVVRVDKRLDLALLKVEISDRFVPIPIIHSAKASLGDKVYTIGFPMSGIQGLLPKYTEGTISSLAGIRDESTRFQVSVPVQPGNSGGALVNENGHIVGVIVSGLSTKYFLKKTGVAPQVVNYAIKSTSLLGFLEGTRVRYIGDTGGNSLKRKASIKRTQEGIGQVIAR